MSSADAEPGSDTRMDPEAARMQLLAIAEAIEADDLDRAESTLVELLGQVRMLRGER